MQSEKIANSTLSAAASTVIVKRKFETLDIACEEADQKARRATAPLRSATLVVGRGVRRLGKGSGLGSYDL
jgi:hypothetical protein